MDFEITKTGDLAIVEKETADTFQVRFRIGDPGLQVSFFLLPGASEAPSGSFGLSFSTANKGVLTGVSAAVIENDDELVQRIWIALATELGDLRNRADVGSKISLVRHKPLFSQTVLDELQLVAQNAISSLVSDATIVARPELGTGFLYCSHVSLYVYRGGKLLTRVPLY